MCPRNGVALNGMDLGSVKRCPLTGSLLLALRGGASSLSRASCAPCRAKRWRVPRGRSSHRHLHKIKKALGFRLRALFILFYFMEVTVGIEPTTYGFANRPISHSGTSPRYELALIIIPNERHRQVD